MAKDAGAVRAEPDPFEWRGGTFAPWLGVLLERYLCLRCEGKALAGCVQCLGFGELAHLCVCRSSLVPHAAVYCRVCAPHVRLAGPSLAHELNRRAANILADALSKAEEEADR